MSLVFKREVVPNGCQIFGISWRNMASGGDPIQTANNAFSLEKEGKTI